MRNAPLNSPKSKSFISPFILKTYCNIQARLNLTKSLKDFGHNLFNKGTAQQWSSHCTLVLQADCLGFITTFTILTILMYYLWLYHIFSQFFPANNGLIYIIGSKKAVGGGKPGWVSTTGICQGNPGTQSGTNIHCRDFEKHVYNAEEFFSTYALNELHFFDYTSNPRSNRQINQE